MKRILAGSYVGFAFGIALMALVDVGDIVPPAALVAVCLLLSGVFSFV